ncbi:MAG TPA: transporter [Candidatus Acidoferrum sp.]|nr:transporter [Candidatus Acidoferrum sp.]
MKQNTIHHLLTGAALATLLAAPLTLKAQPDAHYVPGSEGLLAATLPPPGVYLRDYNAFYYADQINDGSGNKINGANVKAFVYAQVPRIIWITDFQVLGGYIGIDGLVPFEYQSLKAGPFFNDHTFGVGDPFAEVTWSAHTKQFDISAGFGTWFPTENFNAQNPTWAGSGYWDYMFTAGATWYPDTAKKWSVSALNRYEINAQQDDTGITPGQVWTIEGGIGYNVWKPLTIGAAGYYQLRTTHDTGSGAPGTLPRVGGIGPEIATFFPSATLGVSLRYEYEFLAESRLQGHTIMLTVTKKF